MGNLLAKHRAVPSPTSQKVMRGYRVAGAGPMTSAQRRLPSLGIWVLTFARGGESSHGRASINSSSWSSTATLKGWLTSRSGPGRHGATSARVVLSQLGKLLLWIDPSHSSPKPPLVMLRPIHSIQSVRKIMRSASLVTIRS